MFIYLFILLVSDHYHLDVSLFEKIQDYEEKTLSSSKSEARQVFLDHIDPICFLPLVTHLHALIRLPIPYVSIGLGLWLVDLLSPAVMSVVQVFPSYMMLSLACVCHTWFLCQNRVLIVCTQNQMFHTYGQKCSQVTKCHSIEYIYYINNVFKN
jgi:hypothetical protein